MILEQLRNILILAILVTVVWSIGIFFKLDQEAPRYSQQTMKEAIIYFNKSEEYEKALLLAKEYVNLYPDDIEGFVHRGYAYHGLGNCTEASTDFYHASVNGNETADSLIALVANSETCKNRDQ